MSTKRQPSKQRRQTQNQRQRAAVEARRQAAAAGPVPAGKVGGRSTSATSASSSRSTGSVLSRFRGATPTGAAGAGRPPRSSARTSSASHLPVGHRAALSAVMAAVAGAVVGSVLLQVPIDRSGDAITTRETLVAEWAVTATDAVRRAPEATPAKVAASITAWLPGGREPYARAYWPMSAFLLLPVLGAGLGFRAVSRRSGAKLVNRTMYVTLFGSLLVSQLSLVFLPAVLSLAVAAFQVRKAEALAARAAATDGVIDVDAVAEDDVADDDVTGDKDGLDARRS